MIGVLAAGLVSACGSAGDAPPGATMAVDTVDGIVHVVHTGRAATARLDRRLVLGGDLGLDEESPSEFGRVQSVLADDAGRLYVADGMALEIRVFEPDGRFLRALGRKGGGPGEFEGVHGAAWLTADTLMVVDFGNARLGLMDREGRHLGQWPWMSTTGSVRFYFPVGQGEVYARGIRASGQVAGDRQRMEAVWVRHTAAGPADSLAVPQPGAPTPGTSMVCRGEGGIGFFTNPHGERILASPAPGGERIVARSSEYRLAFLDGAGDTVRILSREAAPVPLTDDDWRETDDGLAEFRQRWRGADCEGEIRRPRYRRLLRDLAFDHHGRLLVEVEGPEGASLDVYDADWRWLATLPLPPRDTSVPLFLRDNRLYLVAADDLGVQRVEVYDVAR